MIAVTDAQKELCLTSVGALGAWCGWVLLVWASGGLAGAGMLGGVWWLVGGLVGGLCVAFI